MYTTFCHAHICPRVNLVLHEHPVVKYKTFTRVRGGDEPLLSGEERYGTEDERILRNLWWNITMTGRCSICLVYNSGW